MHRKSFLALIVGFCFIGMPHLSAAERSSTTEVRFRKQVLTDQYFCDGITALDINRDGKIDIVAGPFWYEGPHFTNRHEIYPAIVFPTEPSPSDSMFSFGHDFNGDQWPDVLVLGRVHVHQAFWYENPQGKTGFWRKHFVLDRIKGESPAFQDVDGDSRPELVTHDGTRWVSFNRIGKAPPTSGASNQSPPLQSSTSFTMARALEISIAMDVWISSSMEGGTLNRPIARLSG